MSRNSAGAVIFSAFQRIECFCRTRIFSRPMRRCQLAAILGTLVLTSGAFAGSETVRETKTDSRSLRRFTLRQAIETAFQRNPAILTARQEIRRTKGVQIQVLSQALPHLDATAAFNYTDPSLRTGSGGSLTNSTGGVPTPTPVPTATPISSPALKAATTSTT